MYIYAVDYSTAAYLYTASPERVLCRRGAGGGKCRVASAPEGLISTCTVRDKKEGGDGGGGGGGRAGAERGSEVRGMRSTNMIH